MIIMNLGVPRSGTVLVNAIVRTLLERAGVSLAVENPHGAEVLDALQRSKFNAKKATVIHTHSWDSEIAEGVKASPGVEGFINYRDPRDVTVSLMKLHDHDFRTAARMTMNAFRLFLMMCRDTDFLVIRYESMISNKADYICQISQRLGLQLDPAEVDQVDQRTSVSRHRQIMDDVRNRKRERLNLRQNRNRVLVEDRDTLINDRHIQSGEPGRWRRELVDEHSAELTRYFAPILERYDYPPEKAK